MRDRLQTVQTARISANAIAPVPIHDRPTSSMWVWSSHTELRHAILQKWATSGDPELCAGVTHHEVRPRKRKETSAHRCSSPSGMCCVRWLRFSDSHLAVLSAKPSKLGAGPGRVM